MSINREEGLREKTRWRAGWIARCLLSGVTLMCSYGAFASGLEGPWAGPPFSGKPAEMLKAAAPTEEEKGFPVTVLLDERRTSVDVDGTTREQVHLVYRVDSATGVRYWGSVRMHWAPWHQKQPEIRARVITADGVEHILDAKTLSDAPEREDAPEVYSDSRVYRGPLPAVAIGAIVETEITLQDVAPTIPGGVARRYVLARRVPVRQARVWLDMPASVSPKYEVRLLPNAVVDKSTAGPRTFLKIETGAIGAVEEIEPNLPSDFVGLAQVEFSTVPSWREAAASYQKMVEPQVRINDVRQLVSRTVSATDSRAQKVRKLTAKLHQLVRYTGIEFGESELVPQPPAEVLKRKYGDCKEKAALLVAMLRASGIQSYVALLKAGDGQDISPSMPGDNQFNHAIVFLPGSPNVWIDATDEFSPPGQLPLDDQGKQALVIADDTAATTLTPISAPADNLLLETREFHLREFGPARVVETSFPHGSADAFYRGVFGTDRDTKKVEKQLVEHAKEAYLSDDAPVIHRGDGTNLNEAFLLRIEIDKAKRGSTSIQEAGMAIFPFPIVNRLPEYFKQSDEELAKERKKTSKPLPVRTVDYVLHAPFVTEWRYRIFVPTGFQLRALPPDKTQEMGPARFTQVYAVDTEGVINATLRFDTVKHRFTVAEGEALRKAVDELRNSPPIVIAFDQIGYALLSSGKIQEAVAAFDRLVKLHPGEGLHHMQIAYALLEAGLGDAARLEASEAVRLEPDSALAHRAYGWVLGHDLIGRPFEKSCDLTGATREFRKSLELDPTDDDARAKFAMLLEYDSNLHRDSDSADLKAAAEQYRELKRRKSTEAGLDNDLLNVLFYARQFKEIEGLISQLDPDPTRNATTVATRAVSEGAEAGLKKSLEVTSDEKSRMKVLIAAANLLLNIHAYKEAAGLLTKVNTGAFSLEFVTAVAGAKPYLSLATPEPDASGFVRKMLMLVVGPESPDPQALEMFTKVPAPTRKGNVADGESADSLKELRNYLLGKAVSELPPDARGDVFLSSLKTVSEGDERSGYRVTLDCLGLTGFSLYVLKEGDRFKVLPHGKPAFMGRAAITKLEQGDLMSARKWLDWARDEQTLSGGDDPLSGPLFPRVWRKGQEGGADAVRSAAAVLLVGSEDVAGVLPALLSGRDAAKEGTSRTVYDIALFRAYVSLQRWEDARTTSERLLLASPESSVAFASFVQAHAQSKDWASIETAARRRLERNSEDVDAVQALAMAAAGAGKLEGSMTILRSALTRRKPSASLLNQYAWNGLFLAQLPDDAIEVSQKAVRLTENKKFEFVRTLAAVYAEVGRVGEARKVLLDGMDQNEMAEPNSAAWYVIGRIAEQFGRDHASRAAYMRVEQDQDVGLSANSTYDLAQVALRRLDKMGKGNLTSRASKP